MNPEFKFQTNLTIRIGDINYGGHLGNDKYLLLFHDARIKFLQALDFSERDIGDGIGLIMSEAHINFRAEAFLGDELKVGVRITDLKNARFNIEYEIERVSDDKLVASGYTRMVAFDYSVHKVSKIPEIFRQRVECYAR